MSVYKPRGGRERRMLHTILAVLLAKSGYLRICQACRSLNPQGRQDLIGLSCKGVFHYFAVEFGSPVQNGMEVEKM